MKDWLVLSCYKSLEREAKRVFDILFEWYQKNEKINMTFENAIRGILKKEYKYFDFEITGMVYSYIPHELAVDPKNEYVFIAREESNIIHITKYSKCCMRGGLCDKNPKLAAEKFADILIDMDNKNQIKNSSLWTLLVEKMNLLYPRHNDSMDAKAILLYLPDAIESRNYSISKVEPLVLKRIIPKNN